MPASPVDGARRGHHPAAMSLAQKTRRAPIPHEPDKGDEVLAAYDDLPDNLAALIRGVAGCSPYLRSLLLRERDWLAGMWETDPDMVLAGLMGRHDGLSPEQVGVALRRAKRRLALYVALADCGGVWELERVTHALTAFADHAVQSALRALLDAEIKRGRLPGCAPGDDCGLVVLAMGKMGAHELNYSSDIDLIVLFDETRHAPEEFETIRAGLVRVTRRLARLLSDVTDEGYVFRTDLRLRPDPSVTPVCLSMAAAERYYESMGRTWERAAFIKARPCAGGIQAGQAFLETLRPFIWRRHLDFAAIEDAHDMRLRIRSHKGLGGVVCLAGHNLKLGRGGIREIEFFAQTHQIIAGGRDPDLRLRGTVPALRMLARKGWIPSETAETLIKAYRSHREIEHRLQMLNDAQTHSLPTAPEQMARLAAFCGEGDVAQFENALIARLDRVHALIEEFFAREGAVAPEADGMSPELRERVDSWHRLAALRSSRARAIFRRILPQIISRIDRTANPTETLERFGEFLAGLPAGVQLFSLFEANPQLLDLLVEICGTAPALARYLSRNAQVFEGVISGAFFEPLPDVEALAQRAAGVMAEATDYEDQLNALRRWMKEQHFRIGVHQLRRLIDGETAAGHYSDLAEACLRALIDPVAHEFARRHGPMPGRGAMVLGMGSLGARSLGPRSDLDLIVIYDGGDAEISEGRRPLPVTTYYARFTQALVTALTSPMTEGRLYEVDMRLRPSGRKGPVATPLSGFIEYQRNKAWTWEHLALTRARPVAGCPELCDEVEAFRAELIAAPRDEGAIRHDVAEMRARIAAAASRDQENDPWECKLGRGRMLDIELLGQCMALLAGQVVRATDRQLECGLTLGWLSGDDLAHLQRAYRRLRRARQVARLLVSGRFDAQALGPDGRDLLLRETETDSIDALREVLAQERDRSRALIDRIIGAV